jgi:ribosomal protein L16/L10AE
MGKGKGKPAGFKGFVNIGRPLFEMSPRTSLRWIKDFIKHVNYRSPIFLKEKYIKRKLYKRVFQAIYPNINTY